MRKTNIAYMQQDINLIADFYLNQPKNVFNENLAMNKLSLNKFKIFLSRKLGYSAKKPKKPKKPKKAKKPKNLYNDYFKIQVDMKDVENGNITNVYNFLGGPNYVDDWDQFIFQYIGNLHDGLQIMINKLFKIFKDNSDNYIKIQIENNFSVPYSHIKQIIDDIYNYLSNIVTYEKKITEIIKETNMININTLITNIKKNQSFMNLFQINQVDLIQNAINDINIVLQDIDNLKNNIKVFKNYIIIEKMFDIFDFDIKDENEFDNVWTNNIILQDYVDKKYLFDDNMKQYVIFIFQFLNENNEKIAKFYRFFRRVSSIKNENNNIYNKLREENFNADITNDNIQFFLTEFVINFKELILENYILTLQNDIDNFYRYIKDPDILLQLKIKIKNFKEFANFKLKNIFINLDANNKLFEGIDDDFLKKETENDYYNSFFGKNLYEINILKIYPNPDQRILKIEENIIISSYFNIGIYGTVKEFIESFIKIYNVDVTISNKNKIVRYILMTDNDITNKNVGVLTEEIKTQKLDHADILFLDKIASIKNLLVNITNEMKFKKNITEAMILNMEILEIQ